MDNAREKLCCVMLDKLCKNIFTKAENSEKLLGDVLVKLFVFLYFI